MAIKYMDLIKIDHYDAARNNVDAYQYEDELSSPANGDTIIIPKNVKNVTVALLPSAGSGKIQVTANKVEDVIADSGVAWIDWDSGVVAANTIDSVKPITAIRQVNVSGTTKMVIRAQ